MRKIKTAQIGTSRYSHGGEIFSTLAANPDVFEIVGRFEVCPLEVSVKYPLQYTEYSECKSTDWNASAERKRSEVHDRYSSMMLAFAQMVRGEMENPYTYDYELELFKMIKKCCE